MTTPPSPLPKNVYKILDQPPSDPLPDTLPTTPLDAKDGFVHLSSGDQVPETARLYFADHSRLWILQLPLANLEGGTGTVKWEGPRGCAHLYGRALIRGDVKRVIVAERTGAEKWEVVLRDLEK